MDGFNGKIHEYKKGQVPKDFLFLSKALSHDETRKFMQCAYCTEGFIYSTDGRRIHSIKNIYNIEDEKYIYIIKSTLSHVIFFESDNNYSHFPNIKRIFNSRTNDFKFNLFMSKKDFYSIAFKLNKNIGVCMNLDFLKDACLSECYFKIYNESENKAVFFENEAKKIVIMPMPVGD